MGWLLHKDHLNKFWLLIQKKETLGLKIQQKPNKFINDKDVSTERCLITSSNSRMRQFQMILLGNRLKTSRREHSFTNPIGKLSTHYSQDAVLSRGTFLAWILLKIKVPFVPGWTYRESCTYIHQLPADYNLAFYSPFPLSMINYFSTPEHTFCHTLSCCYTKYKVIVKKFSLFTNQKSRSDGSPHLPRCSGVSYNCSHR